MVDAYLRRLFFVQMVAWLCFAPASCTEPHGTDGGLVRLHPQTLRPTDLPLPPFTEIHTDDAQCTAKPPPDLPRFAPSRMSRANHVTDPTPPIHRQDKSPNITHGPTKGRLVVFRTSLLHEPHGTHGGLVRLHPRPLRPTDLPLPPFTEIHTDDAQCTAKPPPDLPRFAPSRMSRANHVTDPTPPIHRQDKSPNITHGPTNGRLVVFRTSLLHEPHGTDGGLVQLHPQPLRPTDLPLLPFTEIHTDDAQCTAKPPPDLPRFAPSRMSRANHVTDPTPPIHRQDKSPNITHGPTSGLDNTSRMADAYPRRLFFVRMVAWLCFAPASCTSLTAPMEAWSSCTLGRYAQPTCRCCPSRKFTRMMRNAPPNRHLICPA
nr:mucin-2-like [Rhipicephalus microplus]